MKRKGDVSKQIREFTVVFNCQLLNILVEEICSCPNLFHCMKRKMSLKKKRTLPSWMKQPNNCECTTAKNETEHSNLSCSVSNKISTQSESQKDTHDSFGNNESDDRQGEYSDMPAAHSISDSDTDVDEPKALNNVLPEVKEEESNKYNSIKTILSPSPILANLSDQQHSSNDATNVRVIIQNCADSPSSSCPGTPNTISRRSCFYGSTCYRKNPEHRKEFAHPGDSDFCDPSNVSHNSQDSNTSQNGVDSSDDRPLCEYGSSCYRKNPQHRRDFRHDASKKRKARPDKLHDIISEDEDFNASFGSDDYNPIGSESDDSFVTSDSMDSGNSDYSPGEDEGENKKRKTKNKKAPLKKKGKAD